MTNTSRTIFISILLTLSVLLGACAAPESEPTPAPPEPTEAPTPLPEPTARPEPDPITLTDGLGNSITLEAPAQRIVSLAPSNTEILFAIGAGPQVVGRDSFSDFPAEALELPDIGGGFAEVNTELVLSLEPDLVLAADITPPEQIQSLIDLGLTVFALSNPTDLDGMYQMLATAAILTGREAETEALVSSLKERVVNVQEIVAGAETTPLVFYELDGTDPAAPWTSGPGTFIDTLITMAGGKNLGGVLDNAWAQISLEQLIAENPDLILLGDALWGGVTPEDVAARGGWDAITAVQNDQVFPFDDNIVGRPGPRLVDGLEALAEFLHPELFD